MWSFLRRQSLFFLIGFIVTFVVYLFIKIGSEDVLLGIAIGAGGGVLLSGVIVYLERKFPDRAEVGRDD